MKIECLENQKKLVKVFHITSKDPVIRRSHVKSGGLMANYNLTDECTFHWYDWQNNENAGTFREAIKKVTFLWTLSERGGGAQPHSIAFGGVFINFTEAIFG